MNTLEGLRSLSAIDLGKRRHAMLRIVFAVHGADLLAASRRRTPGGWRTMRPMRRHCCRGSGQCHQAIDVMHHVPHVRVAPGQADRASRVPADCQGLLFCREVVMFIVCVWDGRSHGPTFWAWAPRSSLRAPMLWSLAVELWQAGAAVVLLLISAAAPVPSGQCRTAAGRNAEPAMCLSAAVRMGRPGRQRVLPAND